MLCVCIWNLWNMHLHMLHSQITTLKVRVCHRNHMFTVFSSAPSVPKTRGWMEVTWVWFVDLWTSSYLCTHTNQHIQISTHQQMFINWVIRWSIPLHHWMALLLLSPHPVLQSLPPFTPVVSRPFPATHPCVGGRLESPESTTRITRSISETISFCHLFYMAYPSVFLSSLPLSFICSVWLIYVFTLCPSSHSSLLAI